jgi:hypothetical protein
MCEYQNIEPSAPNYEPPHVRAARIAEYKRGLAVAPTMGVVVRMVEREPQCGGNGQMPNWLRVA